MNITGIKEKLTKILISRDLKIYSIKTKKEFGNKILEILIDVDVMDINELEKIHLELVDLLSDDDLDDDYYLELSSLGAERPIQTVEEATKVISQYVYLESPLFKGYGYLTDVKELIITIEVNLKGRIKKIDIPFDSVKNMRTAIKF